MLCGGGCGGGSGVAEAVGDEVIVLFHVILVFFSVIWYILIIFEDILYEFEFMINLSMKYLRLQIRETIGMVKVWSSQGLEAYIL